MKTISLEQALETLNDLVCTDPVDPSSPFIAIGTPAWRRKIRDLLQSNRNATKERGAPHSFHDPAVRDHFWNVDTERLAAAYRIQQELSNPYVPFGKAHPLKFARIQAAREIPGQVMANRIA